MKACTLEEEVDKMLEKGAPEEIENSESGYYLCLVQKAWEGWRQTDQTKIESK